AVGAGVSVYDLVNGTALVSSVQTNASGQYTFTLSSALSAGSQVIAYVGSGTSGGVAFQESASGSVSGLNIYETYVAQNAASSSTSLSTVTSDFATAKGANTIPTPGNMAVNIAAASFAINQAVSTGTLVLSSTGTVTQSAAITATTGLDLLGSGATYTLTNSFNSVGALAASVGSGTISLTDNTGLAIGTVDSTSGVSAGTLTLNVPSGDAVTQSATAPVSANLELLGAGAIYTLTNASNSVGTLAANTGSVDLIDNTALTIGTAGGTSGVNLSGTLTLNVNGTISDPTAAVTVGAFILDGGNWSQIGTLPTFTATTDFELNGGTFLRATGGDGSSGNPFTLVDVYGLQGVTTLWADYAAPNVPNNNFDLAASINASGTATWNPCGAGCYAGFVPIGGGTYQGGGTIYQTGTFDGKGFSISGLYINLPNSEYVGLFGDLGTTVQNVSLVNANVTGGYSVGSLVGYSDSSATIINSSATGTVTATSGDVGGLVGDNFGPILSSFTAVTVNGNSSGSYSGGLVGYNDSAISQSYATGSVTGGFAAGGLVGAQEGGSITDAYATGNVSGQYYVGGLVGDSEYGGTITNVYAANQVSGSMDVGGLVGAIDQYGGGGATITNGYWNTDTAGQTGIGADYSGNTQTIQGLTTAKLQGSQPPDSLNPGALPTGFNATTNGGCASCWGIVPGQTYPLFTWQPGVVSGEVFTTYGESAVGSGTTVSDVINGSAGTSTVTNASGNYFFYLGSNGIPANSQVVVYTTGGSGGVSYQQNASGSVSGLNIYGSYLSATTPVALASTLASGLSEAVNGTTNTALQTVVGGLTSELINATGATFAIDQSLPYGSATLVLSSTGTVTQSAPIATTNLALLGTGATYTLTNASNNVGTLAANAGTISLTDSNVLTIGAAGGPSGPTGVTLTGTLTLNDTASGADTINDPTAPISVGTFDLAGGNWVQNIASPATLPSFAAYNFEITGGTFLRVVGGNGSTSTPYLLTDIYGLQGVQGFLTSNFALANTIDAGGTAGGNTNTANWNGGTGFAPIAQSSCSASSGTCSSSFSGILNGQGYAVSNLTINQSAGSYIGLIANLTGTVENIGLTNVSITDSNIVQGYNEGVVAGLVAWNQGAISNSYVTGTVNGGPNGENIGGVVGLNWNSITSSYSAAAVTGGSDTFGIGGLVGQNTPAGSTAATITNSYATGAVTAGTDSEQVGGLVGVSQPGNGAAVTITDSYATGSVSGSYLDVGGLVGINAGIISQSYATGAVNG
ncbi:MAG: GLUG motif-containing protein, partial [Xanthobacteraceae bacterium]